MIVVDCKYQVICYTFVYDNSIRSFNKNETDQFTFLLFFLNYLNHEYSIEIN